jgi:hypothetical protein
MITSQTLVDIIVVKRQYVEARARKDRYTILNEMKKRLRNKRRCKGEVIIPKLKLKHY